MSEPIDPATPPIENNKSELFNFSTVWQQINKVIKDEEEPSKSPIIILGKSFDNIEEAEIAIKSRICLTYRFGFEAIPRSMEGPNPLQFMFNRSLIPNIQYLPRFMDKDNFGSDVGWGCMIRTSQSLLANSFLQTIETEASASNNHMEDEADKSIIDFFRDNSQSPFSLHNFIKVASASPLKVKPGQWFGPDAASVSIKQLCESLNSSPDIKDFPHIKVLISDSSDLYDTEVKEVFDDKNVSALLILLPVRLGIDKVNSYYHSSLMHLLSLPQSVGIAGGKPSSSFYFLGYQDNDLIYMDPHRPQLFDESTDYETYHTLNYNKLDINKLDPSMMIGILVQNWDDFEQFKSKCITDSNKIIHFPKEKLSNFENSIHAGSEFVNIDSHDLPKNDEFINIKHPEQLENVEDFIDLGNEFAVTEKVSDGEADISEIINNDSPSEGETEISPVGDTDQYVLDEGSDKINEVESL
ncbi:putative cysteine protease ATG4 [Scheffersomyces coipomensis]|uniref:putative cysteine protease ATG4 n=1 Tax=Scheffersomyces coipomensis TaxID=1788519 RepID=UPI00315D9EDD